MLFPTITGIVFPQMSTSQVTGRSGVAVRAMGWKLAVLCLGSVRGYPFRANTELCQHSFLLPLLRAKKSKHSSEHFMKRE